MDDTTLVLTGQLPFVILAAAIAAFPVSLGLLALYRRRVLGFMSRGALPAGGGIAPGFTAAARATGPVELALTALDPGAAERVPDPLRTARSRANRLGLIYATGGAVFTLIMTFAVLVSGGMEALPVRVALVFAVYAWPVVLTLNLVNPGTRRRRRARVVAYVIILTLLAAVGLARSETLTLLQVATLWLITNAPPTILVLAFLARRIRAVGPMVVSFMILCFVGAVLATGVVGSEERLMRAAVTVGTGAGLGAGDILAVIIMTGFVLFGVLGWLALGWLRRAYEARRMSDQSLTADSLWLLFGVVQSIGLAFEGVWWVLSGVVAFAAYKAVILAGTRLLGVQDQASSGTRSLLLLRVFSLGARSEPLFDAVTGTWRHLGPVRLIAGPDLATTTVEPHEFLSFLSGHLGRLFIDGEETLQSRLEAVNPPPDFDGRHRIQDYFCYDDTWEIVLSRLVERSDAVLMDLRSFAPGNAGCVRELQELMAVVSLEQVVLVVDDSTDSAFLENTLRAAAAGMGPASPNNGSPVRPRVFRLSDPGSAESEALLAHLAVSAAAAPARRRTTPSASRKSNGGG